MVKRKPIAQQVTNIPPYPATPPPPPPSVPPPAVPIPAESNHVLDATDAWDNEDDDNGSDWWDHSDDEDTARAKQAHPPSQPTPGQTVQPDLLDFSPTLKPQKGKNKESIVDHEVGDLGIGELSIGGSSSAPRSLDKIHTNPFLRRPSDNAPEVDTENTASIWQEVQPQQIVTVPQLPMPNFPREPLSPKLFDEWADGHIAKSSAPQPTINTAESDNPWRISGIGNPTKHGSMDRKFIPSFRASNVWGSEDHLAFNDKPTAAVQNQPQIALKNPHISIPAGPTAMPDVDTPQTTARKQRSESYQIKHIRWHDAKSNENPRTSPILTQNANGPCPLLALVNVLVLSTPDTLLTPLVDTLRTREQVSLGLLLDAVFDELMSDRRGGSAYELPDVGDLYSFLVTLHTGMNVNPRFIRQNITGPNDMHMGTFEETKEMRLYSTFSVPLIHGWLPSPSDEAFGAFQRLAQTYEDAQNMQFREADLEQKLHSEQLSDEEETLYIDLTSIREFLTLWPTQLTEYGLQAMNQSLQPAEFAILFRNDHFSTIYKEPRSNQLMTLVTDAGYATHDEIIWESLVDIGGSRSELHAGDFKSVSHHGLDKQNFEDEGEWTTVESKTSRGRRAAEKAPASNSLLDEPSASSQGNNVSTFTMRPRPNSSRSPSPPPQPPRPRTASEQEDHDLALALQLQEEEEQALRTHARLQEDEATQRYLNQESSRRGPDIPPRRSNNPTTGAAPPLPVPRPAVNPTRNNEEDEAPPPPYEQATAKGARPFVPPQNHPSSEHAPIRSSGTQSPTEGSSLYTQNSQTYYTGQPTRGQMGGRRRLNSRGGPVATPYHAARGRGAPIAQRAQGVGPARTAEEEDKCSVM